MIFFLQGLDDLIFDLIRVFDLVRNQQVKNEIDLIFAIDHAEIVERKLRINGMNRLIDLGADREHPFVVGFDGIHMDDQENVQLLADFPLGFVDDLMGSADIRILRHLRVNGSDAPAGSVVVYDEVMGSHDAVVAFHHFCDGRAGFRISRSSDQRGKRISGDADTRPYDDGSHDKADETVHIQMEEVEDQDGRIVFTADLPINGNYYVKEVQAPAGFVTTEEIKEFDFAYAGEEVAEVSFEFTYEDEPTTFEITKSDITTGEELPGAKLKVSDSEGNVVDEWTSGSTPHIIKELEVGKKYTLTETIPADGYATAESITFVVENTADIQKVEMQDDTTKILISKVDMTDGSSEVKGAKLYILNENQEVMESWTSGDQHHYVEKLPIGTYTLLEETAPKGYIVANKVTFEIKDTGDIQGTKMEDEQAMGKVILNKTDKDTKKPMKGVEFALCDSKGKVLETLVTDSAGHAESKNYPIATFKNGQYKKAITYILKETKTLDGYQLDETEHKIQFEYVNDRTPVIEYTLDLTNKKAPEKDTPETSENQGVSTPGSHGSDATSVSNSPKTGDNTNIAIFVLALAVSAGCLGTVVTVKRKRK